MNSSNESNDLSTNSADNAKLEVKSDAFKKAHVQRKSFGGLFDSSFDLSKSGEKISNSKTFQLVGAMSNVANEASRAIALTIVPSNSLIKEKNKKKDKSKSNKKELEEAVVDKQDNPPEILLAEMNPPESNKEISTKEDESADESIEEMESNEDTLNYFDNFKCPCSSHLEKEYLNMVVEMSVDSLFETFFTQSNFSKTYWKSRKLENPKVEEWKEVDSVQTRIFEFTVDVGAFGTAKNKEIQKLVFKKTSICYVIESETESSGVPYSESFTVKNRFCLTRCDYKSSRLFISASIFYKQKPNFIAKGIIERNVYTNSKECYAYLEKHLPEYGKQLLSNSSETKVSSQPKEKGEKFSSKIKEKDEDLVKQSAVQLMSINNELNKTPEVNFEPVKKEAALNERRPPLAPKINYGILFTCLFLM